jgi:hypothetical protein
MPPGRRPLMVYLLLSFLNTVNPRFPDPSISKVRKYKMVFTYSMIQARCRVPFRAWWNPAGTR